MSYPCLRQALFGHTLGTEFERSILVFADTPPTSRKSSFVSNRSSVSARTSISATTTSLMPITPVDVTPDASRPPSRTSNPDLTLAFASYKFGKSETEVLLVDDTPFEDEDDGEEEEKLIDMSVRILPGVRRMIDSLPDGTYAVATSGAKTYCHGCLTRTGSVITDRL